MPSQMQTLSVRVPSEDIEWLATLDLQGAASPSDKLRALIAQMRRQHQGGMDYAASFQWIRDVLGPSINSINTLEHSQKLHSEAVTIVADAIPQLMANLLSARSIAPDDLQSATEFEKTLVQRVFQLSASMLRLAMTKDAICYKPSVIADHSGPVIEIAEIVAQIRATRKE